MHSIELPVRYFRFYPADAPLGSTQKDLSLDPAQTALLLIDVYHAAENPAARDLVNSKWDEAWWQIVDQKLVKVIMAARKLGLPVVYVSNSSPRIEILRSPFGMRLRESLGFDPTIDFREPTVDPIEFDAGELLQLYIPSQIAPQPGDYFIRKHTYSGFFETRLDGLLRNLGVKNLICAGFAADVCVLFTLAEAVFRGYTTVLVRDCTLAAEHPDEVDQFIQTQRTIRWIETFLNSTITTDDFLKAAAR